MAALEVVFLTVFWSWVLIAALFLRQTLLPRLPLTATPDGAGMPSEVVHFFSTDGICLEGWKIFSSANRPWILLCHGMGTNRSDLIETAGTLHRAGFNLLLFDFRGHGGSEGQTTSFGWLERQDLEGALAFLGAQADVPPRPIGIYGISMGAAVAIQVAAADERIGAIIADSPYLDLESAFGRYLALFYRIPPAPVLWLILATYRARFGAWPRRVSPLTTVRSISPRPLLLICGDQDARTPPRDVRRVFEAAGAPKDLWLIAGAGHLQGLSLNPPTYQSRIVVFFQTHLK